MGQGQFNLTKQISIVLAAALVMTLFVNVAPVMTVRAEDNPDDDNIAVIVDVDEDDGENYATPGNTDGDAARTVITAFAELADDVANQIVPFGTALEALTLPDSLDATVSDGEDETDTTLEDITWQSEPEYAAIAGTYVFTPTLPNGNTRADSVTLPVITVEVEQQGQEPQKQPQIVTIAAFAELDEEIMYQGFPMPADGGEPVTAGDVNFPASLEATDTDGNAVEIIGVTWVCADYDFAVMGAYVFTPQIPDGYITGEDASLPEITVYIVGDVGIMPLGAVVETEVNDLNGLQSAITNAATDGTETIITINTAITIIGDVNLTGPTGSKITLLRGVTGYLFGGTSGIQSGASLTLENITIDGNKSDANYSTNAGGSLVYVSGGTFNMNIGATLQNNVFTSQGGGVYVLSGTFNMTGGTISNNTASGGGGVTLMNSGAKFNMTGGTITGNSCGSSGYGGGVNVGISSGTFTVGGTAKVYGNYKGTDTANNVNLASGKTITLGTDGNVPTNMEIWVSSSTNTATIVSSAASTDAQYFHADNDTLDVVFDSNTLKLAAAAEITTNAQLVAAIGTFNGGTANTTLIIADSFAVLQTLTVSGAAELTIRSKTDESHALKRGSAADTGNAAVTGNLFTVSSGAKLTLDSITIDGNKDNVLNAAGSLVYVNGGTFTMNSGATLQNNKRTSSGGGGVVVYNGGSGIAVFTMNSGSKISGNTASGNGGGVGVDNQSTGTTTFNMNGGTIGGETEADKNSASGHGGGVYVYNKNTGTAIFNMSGDSKISGNTASGGGGGVFVSGPTTFNMTSGTIMGNAAGSFGGGVAVYDTTTIFNMTGGAITGNSCGSSSSGGGVDNYGTFTVGGGAVVNGNTKGTGASAPANNVYLYYYSSTDTTITLGTPAGMSIGVTLAANHSGTFVTSGAGTDDTIRDYFFSDSSAYKIVRDGVTLNLAAKTPQSITASTYASTAVIGTQLTSTDGTYTANDGGTATTHSYQWKRSDNSDRTGSVTNLAAAKNYTPVAADFGKYIWLETTPNGSEGLTGTAVQGDVVRVGVTLTVTVTGAGGGTLPQINSGAAGTGVIIYGQANISFTKTVASDMVAWTTSPNEGTFGDAAAVSTTYTPATAPSAGTIALTATLTKAALTGTVSITGTNAIGQQLTAAYIGGNGSGTIGYQWKAGGTNISGATSSTYTLTGAEAGKVITCVVTYTEQSGSVTGSFDSGETVPYNITISNSGNVSGDTAVTLSASTGLAGDNITLSYVLGNGSGTVNNTLTFSGGTGLVNVTTAGSSTGQTYTVNTNDASTGVIAITAAFTHTNLTPQIIEFASTTQTKTYGDAKFTAAATLNGAGGSGAVTYASSDTDVATVNSTTGEVTVIKAGSAIITATKAADATYAEATATYTLTVNPKAVIVKPQNMSMTAGDALPVFELEYTGLVSGESITPSVAATFSCSGDGSTAGSLTITWNEYSATSFTDGTGKVSNYTITKQETGTLTVSAAGYAVTFDANGGSVTTSTMQTGADGKLAYLPTPTRSGSYSFDGWYTVANGGTRITTTYVFTTNMTVYAHWTYTGSSSGSSSSGGSGSGGSSNGNSTAITPSANNAPQPLTRSTAATATNDAVKQIEKEQQADPNATNLTVHLKNITEVPMSAVKAILETANGKDVKLQSDSMSTDGKAVEVRVTLNPAYITKSVNLYATIDSQRAIQTENLFHKWFDNKVIVISFEQQEDWGQDVRIAAKLDLSKLKTETLQLYSYDKATNTYKQIPVPAYAIDANGYLCFKTPYAGELLVTDRPLVRKNRESVSSALKKLFFG